MCVKQLWEPTSTLSHSDFLRRYRNEILAHSTVLIRMRKVAARGSVRAGSLRKTHPTLV